MKPQKIILPLAALVALAYIAFAVAAVHDFIPAYSIYRSYNHVNDDVKQRMNVKFEDKQIPHAKLDGGYEVHVNGFSFALPGNREIEKGKIGNAYYIDKSNVVSSPMSMDETRSDSFSETWWEISRVKDGMKTLAKIVGFPITTKYDLIEAEYSIDLSDLSALDYQRDLVIKYLLMNKYSSLNTAHFYRFDNGVIKGFQRISDGHIQEVVFFDCKNPDACGYLSFGVEGKLPQAEIDAIIGSVEFDRSSS